MTGSAGEDRDWPRVAKVVLDRRIFLGMTQEDVRAAGGPSTATMRLIEGAFQDSYKPHVIRSLEQALRWQAGSVERIHAGEEPLEVPQAQTEPLTRAERARILIDFARTDPKFLADKRLAGVVIEMAEEAIREEEATGRGGSQEVG